MKVGRGNYKGLKVQWNEIILFYSNRNHNLFDSTQLNEWSLKFFYVAFVSEDAH